MSTTSLQPETFARYETLRPDLVFGDPIPGLAITPMPWESTSTDVHSINCTTYAGDARLGHIDIDCSCGETVSISYDRADWHSDMREEAFALLVEHARTTCAACHGPKPDDTFPRCSGCAF